MDDLSRKPRNTLEKITWKNSSLAAIYKYLQRAYHESLNKKQGEQVSQCIEDLDRAMNNSAIRHINTSTKLSTKRIEIFSVRDGSTNHCFYRVEETLQNLLSILFCWRKSAYNRNAFSLGHFELLTGGKFLLTSVL